MGICWAESRERVIGLREVLAGIVVADSGHKEAAKIEQKGHGGQVEAGPDDRGPCWSGVREKTG